MVPDVARLSPSDLIIRFHLYWEHQPSGSEVCLVHAAVLPDENLIFHGVESCKARLELQPVQAPV